MSLHPTPHAKMVANRLDSLACLISWIIVRTRAVSIIVFPSHPNGPVTPALPHFRIRSGGGSGDLASLVTKDRLIDKFCVLGQQYRHDILHAFGKRFDYNPLNGTAPMRVRISTCIYRIYVNCGSSRELSATERLSTRNHSESASHRFGRFAHKPTHITVSQFHCCTFHHHHLVIDASDSLFSFHANLQPSDHEDRRHHLRSGCRWLSNRIGICLSSETSSFPSPCQTDDDDDDRHLFVPTTQACLSYQ